MKKKTWLKRIPTALIDNWPPILLIGLGAIISITLLTYQLGSLVPGLSPQEAANYQLIENREISIVQTITQDPLFLPFTFGLYVLQIFSIDNPVFIRLISVSLGFLSAIAVFYIISRWHTLRVSLFATCLYVSSAGFLHIARLGDVLSMYLLVPALIAIALYSKDRSSTSLKVIAAAFGVVLTLYTPGIIWIILTLGLIYFKQIKKAIQSLSTITLVVSGSLAFLFAGLLAFTFALETNVLLSWLGLPGGDLPSIREYAINLANVPIELFAWGPDNPVLWIGTAGIIDIFVTVLFFLGCYSYYYQRSLDRTKVLFVTMALLMLLAGLGGPITSFALVPFVYIIAATGLALLLQQWFTVFPKNPFARSVGIVVVIACISMSIFYNTHRYFIAWPRTPGVQAQFRE